MKSTLIIPVHNEEKTIGEVIEKSSAFVDEIIVVDDCSTDKSSEICMGKGVKLAPNLKKKLGYSRSIEKGLCLAANDIILTMDADLEHDPADIPRFLRLYNDHKPNLIIGKRKKIPRNMEKMISFYTKTYYGFDDALVGMRLIEKKILEKVVPFSKNDDYGLSFVIDAAEKGFKILNLDLTIDKRRENPRVGNDEYIENKLKKIFIKVLNSKIY